MLPDLEKKFNRLNKSLNEVIHILDSVNTEILEKIPSEGKWNAVQILYHLELSEALSRGYMLRKLQNINDLDRTGLKSALRSQLLKLFLKTPLKWKAPPTVSDIPAKVDYSALKIKYLKGREELGDILGKIEPAHTSLAIMKHPRIGPINTIQTLDFFESHFDHHRRQIESAIST